MGPDPVAIAECRDTLQFPVQYLTSTAIRLGFTVREVRSQPLQLYYDALMFANVAVVKLRQIFQRRSVPFKFLIDLVEFFLLLGRFGRCCLKFAARILFRGSQA